jgi:hypothetical protein
MNMNYMLPSIEIILAGGIWVILMRLWFGYGIPSRWMFKNRFLLNGLLLGIIFGFFPLILPYNEHRLCIKHLLILLTGFVIGTLYLFIISKIYYNKLCKETKLEKQEGEAEIMSDQASIKNEDGYIAGRLILTNKRLCFMTKDIDNYSLVISINELTKTPEIVNKYGFFNAFYIQDKEIIIYLKYRRYWIKEIKKLMNA